MNKFGWKGFCLKISLEKQSTGTHVNTTLNGVLNEFQTELFILKIDFDLYNFQVRADWIAISANQMGTWEPITWQSDWKCLLEKMNFKKLEKRSISTLIVTMV